MVTGEEVLRTSAEDGFHSNSKARQVYDNKGLEPVFLSCKGAAVLDGGGYTQGVEPKHTVGLREELLSEGRTAWRLEHRL